MRKQRDVCLEFAFQASQATLRVVKKEQEKKQISSFSDL